MIRRRNFLGSALALPAFAVAIAGCGGGGNTPQATATPATPRGAATVDVRSTNMGKVLVDSQGRTLYLFEKDKGTRSTCSGACASAWPPFRTSGGPKAGTGVKASLLGTTARSDGKPEVTYNGHPLYYYAGDQNAGDTNGEGLTQFGAPWYAVSAAGNKVVGKASNPGGGNGGY